MCGIVGGLSWGPQQITENILVRMRQSLSHRGPDYGGSYRQGPIGLAHRRLSVIDLSSEANQPMQLDNDEAVISFNGEIYNFNELRSDLRKRGCSFRTASDTEVLLRGCHTWGVAHTLKKIDGIAAFAYWDKRTGKLYLARDRYGAKPLYIWRTAGAIWFSSEIKAFLKIPGFSAAVNPSALNQYFTFQNVFNDDTLFKGVSLLSPGTFIEIDRSGIETSHVYWDFDFQNRDETIDEAQAIETTENLMREAVHRQMVADVPVGAYLSGGMDSGSVVAIASTEVPRLTTFTAGFELSSAVGIEATFDERRDAEMISHTFNTEHYEQVINAGDIRWAMPRVIWHLEDLRVGMSYPNYYIARLASKFVTVCLSGAGGDELFGGYPWRYYRVFRSLGRKEYLRSYYDFWQRLTTKEDRMHLFQAKVRSEIRNEDPFEVFSQVFDGQDNARFGSPEEQIANALYFECKTFLHGLLVVGDKLSMASGLEERFPFLDNELVAFAQKLPIKHKLADLKHMLSIDEDEVRKKLVAQTRYAGGKSVLRRAMERFLPSEVVNRPKQGFSAPDETWFRGENAAYVRDLLLKGDLASESYIQPDYVRKIVREHTEQGINHRLLIWSFLSFEWWCRLFLEDWSADGQPP